MVGKILVRLPPAGRAFPGRIPFFYGKSLKGERAKKVGRRKVYVCVHKTGVFPQG